MGLFEFLKKPVDKIFGGGALFGTNQDAINDVKNQYGSTGLDQQSENLIGKSNFRATQHPDDITAEYLQGVDAPVSMLSSGDSIERDRAALGMLPDPASSEAIARKVNKNYSIDLNNIKQQEKLMTPIRQMDRQKLSIDALYKRQELMQQRNDISVARYNNRAAARANTISGLFGGAGAIVGGIFGGAQGAQAGQKVGGSGGQSAAGGI